MQPTSRSSTVVRGVRRHGVAAVLALALVGASGCTTSDEPAAVPPGVPAGPGPSGAGTPEVVAVAPELSGAPYTFSALRHAIAGIGHLPLRDPAPSDAQALAAWQPTARERLRRTLGVRHLTPDELPLDLEVISSVPLDGYRRDEVSWFVEPGLRMRAFLFVPEGPGPHPAVLYWHGHSFGGHLASAGLGAWGADDPHHAGADALARTGAVVLAPALRTFEPGAGQRDHVHYTTILRMRGASALGTFVADSLRALDVLVARDDVDPARVGVTGLSLGGYLTVLTAALDDRVAAGVAQGFLGSYRGSLLEGFECPCLQSGALGIEFDVADVAAMAAPTPLRFVAGRRDLDIPFAGQQAAFDVLAPRWEALGAADAVSFVAHDGGHEWLADPAVEWFAEHLSRDAEP